MLDIVSYLSLSGKRWCLLDPQPRAKKDRDNHSSALSEMGTIIPTATCTLAAVLHQDAVRHCELHCSATSLKSMMEGSDSIFHLG